MAAIAAAAAAAGALAARCISDAKITQRSSFSSSSSSSFEAPSPRISNTKITQCSSVSSSRNDALLSTLSPARVAVVTMTCLGLEKGDQQLVLPRSFEELKHIGVVIYGAPFVRVLNEEGAEIDDIRVVRDGDQVVFARQAEELNARVTITCFEKGDVSGKLILLPRSFEELKKIGVKMYGVPFVRVLNEEGAEIDDIRVVRDGDRVVFAKQVEESNARVTITCLEKGDVHGKLVLLPRSFEELKQIGVKKYGASFVRVLNQEGAEINDIQVVRDGDQVVFASQELG